MSSTRTVIPLEVFHWYIIPEVILEHLHVMLVGDVVEEDIRWNAFLVIQLVCSEFNQSARSIYRKIFGVKDEEPLYGIIRPLYTRARKLWIQAKDPDDTLDDLPEIRYREIMANETIIQIYICIAISRRFLNVDVLKPLSSRGTTNLLPRELRQSADGRSEVLPNQANNSESEGGPGPPPCKMRDDQMHRLFLPLSCASKLCDTIPSVNLVYRVAKYIADVTPWYATDYTDRKSVLLVPILLKYVQDLEGYIAREYAVSQDVYDNWVLRTLQLIDQLDNLLQKFQEIGRLTQSFAKISKVPKEMYEVVHLRQILQQLIQNESGSNTTEIQEQARAILVKLE
ncbi:hypothetical protein Clacol_008734 [Clathrus columnatus]|uniref:Uncharacterized protein n=1 Tax=Clathrus columnatus TaxID=1419009 RepID=A0AAV5ARG0_9AGAM|nr:hypothetical protein Clacol_008734 [Clathrus columnatus]